MIDVGKFHLFEKCLKNYLNDYKIQPLCVVQ